MFELMKKSDEVFTMFLFIVLMCLPSTPLLADVKPGSDSFVEGSVESRDFLSSPLRCGPQVTVSGSSINSHVLYQSSFQYQKFDGDKALNPVPVTWTGGLSALMIDSLGRVRSDDGDRNLETAQIDPIVDTCFDSNSHSVRVKFSAGEKERPNEYEARQCSGLTYSNSLGDIGYLWRAEDVLSRLSDRDVIQQRDSYQASTINRYIRTNIGDHETDFIAESFPQSLVGLLNTNNTNDAAKIVGFIRGKDQEGMRSRHFNERTLRLGDMMNSTPVAVGRPAENIHLLYDDASYLDFLRQYHDRRTLVYVGGNDGLLHAFNGGWYDEKNAHYVANKLGHSQWGSGHSQWKLGQETWAFVPFNLLPHLKLLTRKDYGKQRSDHAYFVDQTPYVFDAHIFGSEGPSSEGQKGQADRLFYDVDGGAQSAKTHPHGWGTVMVVGFGRGGGQTRTVRPAYLIFDITDPEQAPKLLAEFSHPKLASTLSVPTSLTVKNKSGVLDWYLAMGSGPTSNSKGHQLVSSEQNAHLLMLNLKTMNLERSFGQSGVMDLKQKKSFVGDILAVDFNLDASTDALYFGTTSLRHLNSKKLDWRGKLFRLRIDSGNSASHPLWTADVLFDAKAPIVNRPMFSVDQKFNRWIHFGTGRFFTPADLEDDSLGMIYGIKEARDSDGLFKMDRFNSRLKPISKTQLIDVSHATIDPKTGQLSGSVSVSPPLTYDTFDALNKRLQQFETQDLYQAGWRKKLATSERVIGSGTILGGVLSQATYRPKSSTNECKFQGNAYLYTLRHTTGTSWPQSTHPFSRAQVSIKARTFTGSSPNATPLITLDEQSYKRTATIIHVHSNGSLDTTDRTLEGVSSKEISWREL